MAKKIPPPTPTDDECIDIGGVTVCPHVVHLTGDQMKVVKEMHAKNVEKARKGVAKAKKKAKTKQS